MGDSAAEQKFRPPDRSGCDVAFVPRQRSPLFLSAAFATLILFPLLAEARDQIEANIPPLLIPLESSESLPPSGAEDGYFSTCGHSAPILDTLASHGIYIQARELPEVLSNVSGGIKQGKSFGGYTILGVDLDMNRIAGIPGGAIHFALATAHDMSPIDPLGGHHLVAIATEQWITSDQSRWTYLPRKPPDTMRIPHQKRGFSDG